MTYYAAIGPFCLITTSVVSNRRCQKQASGVVLNKKAPVYWHHTSVFHGPSASRYSDSLLGGRFGDRIPVGGEIFRIRPHCPWGPPSLLYSGYQVFPGGKAVGSWRWPPTLSSAEVKERVELYLYSPSGSSWPVIGWALPLFVINEQERDWHRVWHFTNRGTVETLRLYWHQFACLIWTLQSKWRY